MIGGSFPRQAIQAVTDTDPAALDELLTSVVRKEVLTVRADKLSLERGQYAFTQSLIRSVAYDTLTRAERKARHLRTAAHLRSAFPDEGAEVAEVIAAHLHDAYKAACEDPDADELRSQAKHAYVQAAERAESVGAPEAAEAADLTAVQFSSDEGERAELIEKGRAHGDVTTGPPRRCRCTKWSPDRLVPFYEDQASIDSARWRRCGTRRGWSFSPTRSTPTRMSSRVPKRSSIATGASRRRLNPLANSYLLRSLDSRRRGRSRAAPYLRDGSRATPQQAPGGRYGR